MKPESHSLSLEAMFEHADFLRHLARALLRDEHGAEDVLQDAWIVALDKPPSQAAGVRAYMASVVRNLASNAKRGERRRDERERTVARPEAASDEPARQLEVQRIVFDAVLSLDEPFKDVVYLRYFEGLMPREIAQRIGAPVKTVKSRLHRALGHLRETLDHHSEGERALWASALLPLVHGRQLASASGSATVTVGGMLLMKKFLVGVFALVLLLGAWAVIDGSVALESRGSKRALEDPIRPAVVQAEPAAPETTSPVPHAVRKSASVTDKEEAVETTGDLALTLQWESDGTPAQDIWVDTRAKNDHAPRREVLPARTNAKGLVRFEGLEAGPIDIYTDRGGRFEVELRAGERADKTFLLPPGERLIGVVRGIGGEPIAGAEVWGECYPLPWPNARLLATTRGNGSFELRGLSAKGFLGVRAAGYLPSLMFEVGLLPVDSEDARRIEFALERGGGQVSGVVLDPEGEPVEGARVLIGEKGGHIVNLPGGQRAEKEQPVAVRSDDKGQFEYAGFSPLGVLPVHAAATGFPIWEGQVTVESERSTHMTIQLEYPATIVGRVLTSAGEPYAGAQVLAGVEKGGGWYDHMFPPSRATSAEDGSFELGWVAHGQREVNASDWSDARQGRAKASVLCTAGEVSELDLRLDLGATISGRVVDGKGELVVGCSVYARPVFPGAIYPRRDRTDENGEFLLANLGDTEFNLEIRAPGGSPLVPHAQLHAIAPGASGLEVLLDGLDEETRTAYVSGRVQDADGAVPRDVTLVLWPESGFRGSFVDFSPATGAFRHGPLPAGRYRINATRGKRTIAGTDLFEIEAGQDVQIGDIRPVAFGGVALDIVGLEREEVAKLQPSLDRDGHGTQSFFWADGTWVSPELLPGAWILRFRGYQRLVPDAIVTLVSGEQITHRVQVGELIMEVDVSCTMKDAEINWSHIELVIRDSRGEVVRIPEPIRRRQLRAGSDLDFHEVLLPFGTFEFEARTDTGQTGRHRLVIEEPLTQRPECEIVLR